MSEVLDGVLAVDKPPGPTSMRVCAAVRARLRRGGAPKRVKVGHGGTLDPLATGVLVVLIGAATRRQAQVMAGGKRYLAEIDLAHRSPTDDAEGPIETIACEPVSREQTDRSLRAFVGDIMQHPPAFSAVKIEGRRAYSLAREGPAEPIIPRARQVRIDSVEILAFAWPIVTVEILCGKGTYIRSIARDLGAALGTGGMLRALRRTAVGPWTIERCVRLDELPDTLTQADLSPWPPAWP
jgi:tRNA pseudouridine55 synthase